MVQLLFHHPHCFTTICNLCMIPNIAIFSIYGWTYVPISHLLPIWSPCLTQLAILIPILLPPTVYFCKNDIWTTLDTFNNATLSSSWYSWVPIRLVTLSGPAKRGLNFLVGSQVQVLSWYHHFVPHTELDGLVVLSYSTLFVTPIHWPSAFGLLQSI